MPDIMLTNGQTSRLVQNSQPRFAFSVPARPVSKVQVASMDAEPGQTPKKATQFTIKADAYVLARGAVANARQLLLSEVGNDLVGRYFLCHPLTQGPDHHEVVVPQF